MEFYADADEPWLMRMPKGRMPEVEAAAASRGFRATDYVPGLVLVPMPQPTTSAVFDIRPVVDAAGLDAFAWIPRRDASESMRWRRGTWSQTGSRTPRTSLRSFVRGRRTRGDVDDDQGWRRRRHLVHRDARGVPRPRNRRSRDTSRGRRRDPQGCRAANLQALGAGLPIYERMGFRTVSRYHTYGRPGSAGELA